MTIRDQMTVIDALKILRTPVGSKIEHVKKNYRRLAMKYHPDKNIGDKDAENKMKQINVAYEICCKYVLATSKQPSPEQPCKRPNVQPVQWVTYTVSTTFTNVTNIGNVYITFM